MNKLGNERKMWKKEWGDIITQENSLAADTS